MCGTPHVSRTTVTGAFSPPTLISPSICASACFASPSTSGGVCVNAAARASSATTSLPAGSKDFLHVVHHPVHLLQRQRERLVRRHVDAGVLQQLDRVLRAAGRE